VITLRELAGRPADWQLRKPSLRRPRFGAHWVGPSAIAGSVAWSWLAFAGAQGEDGPVAFGLFIGAVSIILMAWSFVLAIRIRFLEPLFGGLDAMYRVHRWIGALAVVTMFLHIQIEPELDGTGILGASKSVADAATDLAGLAETFLYVLVGVSILRWIPYRFWRLTHKLLILPYLAACWHFYTAEKSYANGSGWGWWFGSIMVVGTIAYLFRVVVRDAIAPGLPHTVTRATLHGSTLELVLKPDGKPMKYKPGQFAVIKFQVSGLREPHIFTIASAPADGYLSFFIRSLGDWTDRVHRTDLVGRPVIVEGPYGRFQPNQRAVWIAGGVGISAFVSTIRLLGDGSRAADGPPVTLFYSVRSEDDAMAIEVLREAQAAGHLDLVLCCSDQGQRFSETVMADHFGSTTLAGAHVAACGPAGLVAAAERAAGVLGVHHIEREDFDIRQGFGPDLSRPIDQLLSRFARSRIRVPQIRSNR